MSSEEYSFMLWVRNSSGAWELWRSGRTRSQVEVEAHSIPAHVEWRLVALYGGLLEDSVSRARSRETALHSLLSEQ